MIKATQLLVQNNFHMFRSWTLSTHEHTHICEAQASQFGGNLHNESRRSSWPPDFHISQVLKVLQQDRVELTSPKIGLISDALSVQS